MTFDATVNPVVYEGGVPVFIDTEYDTWNINIIRMYALILKGTLPCLLLTSLICFCITRNLSYSWKSFIFEVFAFLVIYGLLMMKFGLKEEEKKEILGKVYCIKRK